MSYANKIQDSLYWWLSKKRPFSINDEYQLELLFVDKINNSAKIRITNLKTGQVLEATQATTEVLDGQD